MMKSFKIMCFIAVFTIGFSSSVFAQMCEVKNVKFRQSGDKIIIQYDLDGQAKKNYKVSLALSNNGGQSFRIEPKALTGDVGKKVRPGKNKEIIWEMTSDYPLGIEGGQFVFAVDAELKKGSKMGFYMIGAGAIGGAVYFFTSMKDDQPTKGSIKLNISDF